MDVTSGLSFPHHRTGLWKWDGLPRWEGLESDVRAPTVCRVAQGQRRDLAHGPDTDSLIQGIGYRAPPPAWGQSQRWHATEPLYRDRNQSQRHSRTSKGWTPRPPASSLSPAKQRASVLRDWEGPRSGFVTVAVGSLSQSGVSRSPPQKCPSCDPRVRELPLPCALDDRPLSSRARPGPMCPAQ